MIPNIWIYFYNLILRFLWHSRKSCAVLSVIIKRFLAHLVFIPLFHAPLSFPVGLLKFSLNRFPTTGLEVIQEYIVFLDFSPSSSQTVKRPWEVWMPTAYLFCRMLSRILVVTYVTTQTLLTHHYHCFI